MNNSQSKTNTLPTKLKAERPMPKWVTEANDRVGPKPPAPPPTNGTTSPRPPALPPKKNQAEPDYEVIEFSGQQYSNEPTIGMRPKTPDTRRPESALKCTLCGSNNPWVTCDECAQQIFCASCDDMFHKHPKRKTHLRKAIEMPKGMPPAIPPKAAATNQPPPVAPPRRNKRGMPSPMPLRRDQVLGSTVSMASLSPVPGQQQAWQDRLGSLKRGLTLSNRPLPETPKTPTSDGISSRSTTPNSKSVFDSIQRPPSITLEKIKNKASATLDRMALLQQRYRQHKQGKSTDRMPGTMRDQTLPSDQWSNISSPTHFRSGSMSSGINSFDYPDDPPFNFPQQMGVRNGLNARNMSTSVFNLNQVNQRPMDHHASHMWPGGNQMQQAQSMAHLNCMNCNSQSPWSHPHHPEDWPGAANSSLNRSNISLNMAHGLYPGPHGMMHPPPVFMNMPGMYPYPMGVGMPPMSHGMQPSSRSRVASRASSRIPSPTLSRKSMQIRKKRTNYTENELTDDEDSDNDDRRSLMSQRSGLTNPRRGRRISNASQAILDEEPRTLRSKILTSRREDRRGPSISKSVRSDWSPPRRASTANANQNFSSHKKVYSDSPISPDSEASETPSARALVQAKIQEKLKESKTPVALEDKKSEPDLPPQQPSSDAEVDDAKQTEESIEEVPKHDDSPTLGPPPSTPEHEWECEFCTFVNEANTKICSICCKTPKSTPMQPKSIKVSSESITTTTNGLSKLKISNSGEDFEDQTGARKKDDSPVEDIWATIDENIKKETTKAKRNAESNASTKAKKSESPRAPSVSKEKKVQKISTGCGPSPPKEVPKAVRSTATSPVPQSISTQTYDVLPVRNEDEPPATAGTSTESNNELQDQSYTPPTRNFSPKNMFTPVQDLPSSREAEHIANLERNLRFYRDMSVTAGDRYRSSNDVRLDELPASMTHSKQSFGADYLSMQKAQMYHNDNFFDQYAASKRNEPTRDPEIELFMMLKEAEHYKFTAEELHAALKHCGDMHPIIWLRENWPKLIQTVQGLATKYGQERIENVIGTISTIEAREALRLHGGNVWQAITECVEQRQRKYLEISAKGNYSREDIVTALTAHHGNVELAISDLSKTQLKPFLMRVWGSPGGVENDSANYVPMPPKTDPERKGNISDDSGQTSALPDEPEQAPASKLPTGTEEEEDSKPSKNSSQEPSLNESGNNGSVSQESPIVEAKSTVNQSQMDKEESAGKTLKEANKVQDYVPSTSMIRNETAGRNAKGIPVDGTSIASRSSNLPKLSEASSTSNATQERNGTHGNRAETETLPAKETIPAKGTSAADDRKDVDALREGLKKVLTAATLNEKLSEESMVNGSQSDSKNSETKSEKDSSDITTDQSSTTVKNGIPRDADQQAVITLKNITTAKTDQSTRDDNQTKLGVRKEVNKESSPNRNKTRIEANASKIQSKKEPLRSGLKAEAEVETNITATENNENDTNSSATDAAATASTPETAEERSPSPLTKSQPNVIGLKESSSSNKAPESNEFKQNGQKHVFATQIDIVLKTSSTQQKEATAPDNKSLIPQMNSPSPASSNNTFPNDKSKDSPPKSPGATQEENEVSLPSTSKTATQPKSPTKKTASKIPKPNGTAQLKSVPARSKSFSGPSPIGFSSIRAIQQELFNKQSQLAKPSTAVQKLAPPTIARKKSISEAISKFTQVTAEHSVQRSRTQPKMPKIPKKKYHETCFSDDDYQGSTSEEETPTKAEVRLRKHSAPVFKTYASIQEPVVENPEVLAKRLIEENLVTNMAEAQLAAALVGMKFPQDVSIWAAKECCDLDQAISLLQQDCELCMGSYPLNQIVSMLKCTHKCCKQCAKNYFTIQITDRSINDCNCPFCKIPQLQDPNIHEDESLEYFSNLDIFLKNIIEPEVHELFQRKLRDRTLMQDPNFKWCIQCSSGFFARPKQKRLICPDCGSVTCSQCRKTWEKQHEGISCEKFQEWKEANDPEIQAKGVADHLAVNGIDCPKCHFKYSLARGGCMHFTCTQCKFEFCYGCSKPFRMGAKCTVSPYCSKLGLHSHHPRSCLFYLRDKDPQQLQNLLIQNDIPFDVDPIETDDTKSSSKCPIPLQKETPKGLVDTVCNAEVQPKNAGLCRQHYVEYLAGKVSKAGIDPLPILDLTDCVQELRRRGLPLPERGPWDTDEIYRNMCSDVIREKIPID